MAMLECAESKSKIGLRLLLVDNDINFVRPVKNLLESVGYLVTIANDEAEAIRLLEERHFHLGVFDRKLENDENNEDYSGLRLANSRFCEHLPVVVITGLIDIQTLKTAAALGNKRGRVVEVVDKNNDNELLSKLTEITSESVSLNWDLMIQQEPISLGRISAALLEQERLVSWRAIRDELDNLFRRLFPKHEQIRIQKILWTENSIINLSVVCFSKENPPEIKLVTIGYHKRMEEYRARYDEIERFAGAISLRIQGFYSTSRLTGLVFAPLGLGATQYSLVSCYHSLDQEAFETLLTSFLAVTLPGWLGERGMSYKKQEIPPIWSLEKHIHNFRGNQNAYLQGIAAEAARLDLELLWDSTNIWLSSSDQQSKNRIDFHGQLPFDKLGDIVDLHSPKQVFHTPGILSGESLLTDGAGRVWITGFSHACKGPLNYPYVQMEAMVRFEWFRHDITRRFELERLLEQHSFLDIPQSNADPHLEKALRSISLIRQHAVDRCGKDVQAYRTGLLVQVLDKLWAHDPKNMLPDDQIAYLLHLFVAACHMTARILKGAEEEPTNTSETTSDPSTDESGLVMNVVTNLVTIDGIKVDVKGQGFRLLEYLYERAGQIVTREDLGRFAFGEYYDDTTDGVKLNTAILRLRKTIEADSKNPRFLITEPRVGYKLITHPG